MRRLLVFLALAAAAAFGQQQHFPTGFLKASDFYTTGNDGCAQILAATGHSVSNGFGQSVVVDLSGDQICAANPINSNFVGDLIFYNGATFHLAASWIIPSKVMITGAGDGVTTSASSDYTALQACSAVSLPLCPAAFPTNTPLVCFNSCATNTSNLQGFSSSVWFLTVDCNYVAGAIGIRNYYAQENSGLYHDTVINCANNGRGIDIGKSSGTTSGSGYHSTLWRLNVGNATPSNGGTAVCQIGGINVYLATTSGSSVVNPSSISEVTTSNFACDASFGSFKWPLPQYQWEVGGANISIHDVHQEYIGLAGMLVGGTTTGLGAQVSVTTSGGAVNSCTILNRGEGYSNSAPLTFPVYAAAGSGGIITVTWGTTMACSGSGAGNCVQTCVGSGGTLYPTSGLLAPIYDAVSTGGAQSVLLTNIETCCAESYQSTDAIRLQSGATIHGLNAININGLSGGIGGPTNLINDQNHLPIVTASHQVTAQYGLDDIGQVFIDTTGTNPMTLQGIIQSANSVSLAAATGYTTKATVVVLSMPAAAGNYKIHCAGTYNSANLSNGLELAFKLGSSPTNAAAGGTVVNTGTGGSGSGAVAAVTDSTSHNIVITSTTVATAGTHYPFIVDASVVTPSANSFTLQAADTDSGVTTTTIDRGAYCAILP